MTDGIIKGSGNSRYLKSVPNVRTLYPTWDDALDALAAGTFPVDFNGINPSGWEQVGDKLEKATLLTDTLCSALALATTATPTQAMEKIRSMASSAQTTANARSRITSGSYTGSGSTSKTLTLSFVPKMVIVCGAQRGLAPSYSGGWLESFLWTVGTTGEYVTMDSFNEGVKTLNFTQSGGRLSWSLLDGGESANYYQMACNGTGRTYYYIAVG